MYAAWPAHDDCGTDPTVERCCVPDAVWLAGDLSAFTAQACESCAGDNDRCRSCGGTGEAPPPRALVQRVWRGTLDLAEAADVVQAGCQTHGNRRDGRYFDVDPEVEAAFEDGDDPCVAVVYIASDSI